MIGPMNPVLAAPGGTISMLFLVIAFISWLWNVFNGKQHAPGAGGRQQPQPGGKKVEKELQAEINRFLKNVMGQKQGQTDDLEMLEAVEVDEEPRARKKSRAKPDTAQRKNLASLPREGESTTLSSARPGGRISQRKGPGSTTLGSGVRQHLAEHMQEGRVLQQAQSFLGHGVADKVQRDLGVFSGTNPLATSTSTAMIDQQAGLAAGIATMMRDPVGLKQAFVLNLIMNRPTFGKK